ncbi:MAG: asparaginase [Clostridia bacterium]|nr:asparaginase [Clostridia bacterium]
MKNILLILTGGTIGSCESGGIIGTDSSRCRVLELYQEKYNDCRFDVKSPFHILSENLSIKHWEMLINYILSLDLSGYDGMIITHGSDTLSYSSAMLGMCLHGLGLPIVITAANYIPDDKRSNALVNFRAAVNLISKLTDGVYTVFRNGGDSKTSVFIPTRMNEADRISDRFTSFDKSPLSVIDNDDNIETIGAVGSEQLAGHSRFFGTNEFHFDKKVQIIHPYPSINYDNITIGKDTAAVLHITYHSATVSEDALKLLEKCKEKGIPMYLCSFKSEVKNRYETSDRILKNGALPLYDISTESAYAKLLLAVNLCPQEMERFIKQNIYFENLKEV